MLRKLFLIVSMISMLTCARGQQVDRTAKVPVKGIIYDAKTMERVPFAHIIDMARNQGTNADDRGTFSFTTLPGDTIRFTAVGYEDYYLPVHDSLRNTWLEILIVPKTYMLEALDFYATDPMKGFYLKDIERDTIRLGNSKGMPGASYWNGTPSGGTGYITAFANLFNRHHKQEKKLAEIKAEEEALRTRERAIEQQEALIREKYNTDLVRHITDLEGEELDLFMDRYAPTKKFILRSSEYEIALQIVNAFRDYRYENGLEVDVSEILERARFRDY